MKNKDKYRGCLIGGAVGDALGYTVEFMSEREILTRFGKNGITEYELFNGKAIISDDTQMTLFTANGLLLADKNQNYLECIAQCYRNWLYTQMKNYADDEYEHVSWLLNVPELFFARAPGNTCISAIIKGCNGTIENPINNSKGCGGVMRVAPVGLFFDNNCFPIDEIDMLGAKVSALTHGHELSHIASAFFVHIIALVAHSDELRLTDAVQSAENAVKQLFADGQYIDKFIDLIDKAVSLSQRTDISDRQALKQLGEGWVAEETIAVAVYCALKYQHDFEKAIIVSVNHSGDSDSTGAVTGNILGAYLGMQAVPEKFLQNLELKSVILKVADDLFDGCIA